MPNHITNILQVNGSAKAVQALVEQVDGGKYDSGEDRPMDFNNIVPMPLDLRDTVEGGGVEFTLAKGLCSDFFKEKEGVQPLRQLLHSVSMEGMIQRLGDANFIDALQSTNLKDLSDEAWDHFVELVRNMRSHGHTSWYGWSIDNWGTKWNAYDQSIEWEGETQVTFRFNTAWAGVPDLVRLIAEKNPDVTLFYMYADEDTGSNCGTLVFDNGEETSCRYPEQGSKEAYDIAFEISPDSAEWYRFNEESGTYEYHEDDDEAGDEPLDSTSQQEAAGEGEA